MRNTRTCEYFTSRGYFLNCSLTEAFCTAIVEAASCGWWWWRQASVAFQKCYRVTMVTSPAASEKKSTMETGTGGGRRKLKAGKPKEITSSFLAPPTVSGLFEQLEKAIALVANGEIGDREREALGDQNFAKVFLVRRGENHRKLVPGRASRKGKEKEETKKNSPRRKGMMTIFTNRVIEKCTSQGVLPHPLLCRIAALTKLYLKALDQRTK